MSWPPRLRYRWFRLYVTSSEFSYHLLYHAPIAVVEKECSRESRTTEHHGKERGEDEIHKSEAHDTERLGKRRPIDAQLPTYLALASRTYAATPSSPTKYYVEEICGNQ